MSSKSNRQTSSVGNVGSIVVIPAPLLIGGSFQSTKLI